MQKPGFDARERRAGKGWSRLVCFHRLRVRYASFVPVAWCRVIPCRGRRLTKAAPPPLHELKINGKKGNRGTTVTIVGTDVNGTALNNDEPTQPNRGRVAVAFRIGDGNKIPNNRCGAIFKRGPSPAKQTYHIAQKQDKNEKKTKRKEKQVNGKEATAAKSNSRTAEESNTRNK